MDEFRKIALDHLKSKNNHTWILPSSSKNDSAVYDSNDGDDGENPSPHQNKKKRGGLKGGLKGGDGPFRAAMSSWSRSRSRSRSRKEGVVKSNGSGETPKNNKKTKDRTGGG